MTAKQQPKIRIGSSWDGARGRLAPLIELQQAGELELPSDLMDLAEVDAKLKEATVGATARLGEADRRVDALTREIADGLLAKGPTNSPAAPILEARRAVEVLTADRDMLQSAAKQAGRRVRFAFTRRAVELGDALAAALADVLERAVPDAPLLAGARSWTDPDLVHELPATAQAAWHRLERLAGVNDLLRAAAIGLYDELRITTAHSIGPRDEPERFAVERFAGPGVVGPLGRGKGDPSYAQEWAWRPTRGEHPIARLLAAVLATAEEEEPAPEPEPAGAPA